MNVSQTIFDAFQSASKNIRIAAARSVQFLESGNLIPLMVGVSAWHFVGALAGADPLPVALSIGILVDVGMYQLIKASLKYGSWWWGASGLLVLISFGYHVEYYGGASPRAFLLAAPLPILILTLAALSRKQNRDAKLSRELERLSGEKPGENHDSHENPKENHDSQPKVSSEALYQRFKRENLARNGAGPMQASQIMSEYSVSQATAYRWLRRFGAETHPQPETQNN